MHSLRDQANTDHCWAYAMSNLIESRSLFSNSRDVTFNTELDVKYWVDFERMLYMYRTKNDVFLGLYEGGWQIEFWESFLKHGKNLYQVHKEKPTVWYSPFEYYTKHIEFMSVPRGEVDPTLMTPAQAAEKLKTGFQTEEDAVAFITDFLNRRYGKPTNYTSYLDNPIYVSDTPRWVLGKDYQKNHNVDSVVLVKPVDDGKFGWVRYLSDRYWGYRYDSTKVNRLIVKSLRNGWPVSFDNSYHAMTIVGYEMKQNVLYFAIADSIHGEIRWVSEPIFNSQLNLLTFVQSAIPGELPLRVSNKAMDLGIRTRNFNIDKMDNVDKPLR